MQNVIDICFARFPFNLNQNFALSSFYALKNVLAPGKLVSTRFNISNNSKSSLQRLCALILNFFFENKISCTGYKYVCYHVICYVISTVEATSRHKSCYSCKLGQSRNHGDKKRQESSNCIIVHGYHKQTWRGSP